MSCLHRVPGALSWASGCHSWLPFDRRVPGMASEQRRRLLSPAGRGVWGQQFYFSSSLENDFYHKAF